MKSKKFKTSYGLLHAGEFSHLDIEDLREYCFFVWFEDGTVYGSRDNSMHFIDDGCGNPFE